MLETPNPDDDDDDDDDDDGGGGDKKNEPDDGACEGTVTANGGKQKRQRIDTARFPSEEISRLHGTTMEDMCLLYESQTQTYYHDPSSGIAKSGNILANLRSHLVAMNNNNNNTTEEWAVATKHALKDNAHGALDIDLLLTQYPEIGDRAAAFTNWDPRRLYTYRVDYLADILRRMEKGGGTNMNANCDDGDRQLRFELWSWMATNVRALCWVEEHAGTKTKRINSVPHDIAPSLRCVVNAGMNFDTTVLLFSLDFFGITHGTQKFAISKKKRTKIGKRECSETLAFLLNKALPNRCVVRDFLMVLRSTCEESQFVRETFRRMIMVGLIGGYALANTRADVRMLSIVLGRMKGNHDWISWATGSPDSEYHWHRQSLLIWIVREYMHNCINDIPSLKAAISNTNAATVLRRAVTVMDACRSKMMSNAHDGLSLFHNLNLQDHLESPQGVHAATATTLIPGQSDLAMNIWKIQMVANELELCPFAAHMSASAIQYVLKFATGSKEMDDINRAIAEKLTSHHTIECVVNMAKKCISSMREMEAPQMADVAMMMQDTGVDDVAKEITRILMMRKSSIKSQFKQYCQHKLQSRCVFNLTMMMLCKQMLCSQDMLVHRIDSGGGDTCTEQQRCTQFCPWCNRWQCLHSNIPYKKASPLLGRFVINEENQLHCAGSDTGKQVPSMTAPTAAKGMDDAYMNASSDDAVGMMATDEAEQVATAKENGTGATGKGTKRIGIERFRVCQYLPVSRINLNDLAFISSRWLISTCTRCKRPHVREFTTPSRPQRMCAQCSNTAATKKDRKCEVCMKQYRPKPSERSEQGHFIYDNYHTRHCFRSINTCTHCTTRLMNKRRYQHLTLTNAVSNAVRDATLARF